MKIIQHRTYTELWPEDEREYEELLAVDPVMKGYPALAVLGGRDAAFEVQMRMLVRSVGG